MKVQVIKNILLVQFLCINNIYQTQLFSTYCLLNELVNCYLTKIHLVLTIWQALHQALQRLTLHPEWDETVSSVLQNYSCASFTSTPPSPACFSLFYLACHCHPQGSKGTVCDQITGQCSCWEEVGGRHCDRCLQGYFGFPNCRPCLCNGFTELCDPETGSCFNCGGFTTGRNCERYRIHMYFYFLIFFFCSDLTTLSKEPLRRNSTVFKCRKIALGGEDCVIPLPFSILLSQTVSDHIIPGNCLAPCFSQSLNKTCKLSAIILRLMTILLGLSNPLQSKQPSCKILSFHNRTALTHSEFTLASMQAFLGNILVKRNFLDRCMDGYYGDPSSGQPCCPCPCPDVPSSNRYFAYSCYQNPWNSDVICNCPQGYAGRQYALWWWFFFHFPLVSEK